MRSLLLHSIVAIGISIAPSFAQTDANMETREASLVGKIKLPENSKSTFSFDNNNAANLPVIKVTINGVDGYFLMDTGAFSSIFTPEFVKNAKLESKCFKPTVIKKMNGQDPLDKFTHIDKMTLGNTEFHDFDVAVFPLEPSPSMKRYDGIIGCNILLKPSTLLLDYTKKEGTFGAPEPENFSPLKSRFLMDTVFISASLDGGSELDMFVDTGATYSFIFPQDWTGEKESGGQIQQTSVTGTTTSEMFFAKVKNLNSGKINIPNVKFALVQSHRCIGASFFEGRSIFFDAEHKKVSMPTEDPAVKK